MPIMDPCGYTHVHIFRTGTVGSVEPPPPYPWPGGEVGQEAGNREGEAPQGRGKVHF